MASNVALNRKSQPIGFAGRREAMSAPEAAKATTVIAMNGSTPYRSSERPSSTSCRTKTDSVVTTLGCARAVYLTADPHNGGRWREDLVIVTFNRNPLSPRHLRTRPSAYPI